MIVMVAARFGGWFWYRSRSATEQMHRRWGTFCDPRLGSEWRSLGGGGRSLLCSGRLPPRRARVGARRNGRRGAGLAHARHLGILRLPRSFGSAVHRQAGDARRRRPLGDGGDVRDLCRVPDVPRMARSFVADALADSRLRKGQLRADAARTRRGADRRASRDQRKVEPGHRRSSTSGGKAFRLRAIARPRSPISGNARSPASGSIRCSRKRLAGRRRTRGGGSGDSRTFVRPADVVRPNGGGRGVRPWGGKSAAGGRGSPGGFAVQQQAPAVSDDLGSERRFAVPAMLRMRVWPASPPSRSPTPGRRSAFSKLTPLSRAGFPPTDISFLQSIANMLAAAIDRKRAEQEHSTFGPRGPADGLAEPDSVPGSAVARVARARHRAPDARGNVARSRSLQRCQRYAGSPERRPAVGRGRGETEEHAVGTANRRPVSAGMSSPLSSRISPIASMRPTIARKVIGSMAEPFFVDGHEIRLGASIGITICPNDDEDPGQPLAQCRPGALPGERRPEHVPVL